MICMIRCLLLKELAISAFGDDLYHIILGRRLVETMSKCFLDDGAQ
jgi:hypothetical protein